MPKPSSQFRSRDVFPQLVAALAGGDETALGPELTDEVIPPPPERVVAYIDGYGNLKTTFSRPPAPSGTRVHVEVGDRTVEATVSDRPLRYQLGRRRLHPVAPVGALPTGTSPGMSCSSAAPAPLPYLATREQEPKSKSRPSEGRAHFCDTSRATAMVIEKVACRRSRGLHMRSPASISYVHPRANPSSTTFRASSAPPHPSTVTSWSSRFL
jgi:S-adenosyl-l-methionine hydroxide adenosyltransferase